MYPSENTSLINYKIAKFYENSNTEQLEDASQYFELNGAFNSKKIIEFVWPHQQGVEVFKVLQNYKYDDYLKCYEKLLPIFKNTKNVCPTITENSLQIQWLGKNIYKYLEISKNHQNYYKTQTVEHILLLTSLLENALANVYITKSSGRQAPHLLKDLLNTQEVQEVFGIEMVLILKILMGSPNSINLRNIVWHGFPKPVEIPNYYTDALIVAIHSLGTIIDLKNFHLNQRSQIVNFTQQMKIFEEELKSKVDLKILEEFFNANQNNFANDFKPYWQQLFLYYRSKNYIEFIVLILPQIELLLRLHYGYVNNFDITAKLDEYYITMDTIFESEVPINNDAAPKKYNELLNFKSSPFEGCFHLLYDIFISPNGCRLRDKVSHGEVYLEALDNCELCSLTLHIFLNLLFPQKFPTLKDYKSKLHLNCLVKLNLLITREKLENFNLNYLKNSQISPNNKSINSNILIFQRSKKESEFMLLIKKILENILQTINNYEESLTMRSSLMTQRELHSKRRKTLEKLQLALPEIFKTLLIMWQANKKINWILQESFVTILQDENKCRKTLRFLKHSLTLSENFVKYSHYESNEWIKSLDLCRKYQELETKLYLFDQFK